MKTHFSSSFGKKGVAGSTIIIIVVILIVIAGVVYVLNKNSAVTPSYESPTDETLSDNTNPSNGPSAPVTNNTVPANNGSTATGGTSPSTTGGTSASVSTSNPGTTPAYTNVATPVVINFGPSDPNSTEININPSDINIAMGF
ncbi:MAG: hypothetical protein WCW14_03840 [Candidatus Paceibacterota bacterium]|jgi:cytoskeletal protein RodZ